MFYVGQKVVCVDDANCTCCKCDVPKKGEIFTVSHVNPDRDFMGEYGIDLVECPVPRDTRHRNGYRASRFRPVAERKTDISIFTEILNDASNKTPAPVE